MGLRLKDWTKDYEEKGLNGYRFQILDSRWRFLYRWIVNWRSSVKSKLIQKKSVKEEFVKGDLLEYKGGDMVIVVVYDQIKNSTAFIGTCLHAVGTSLWRIGDIRDCDTKSFKLLEGTLELSN